MFKNCIEAEILPDVLKKSNVVLVLQKEKR